MRWLLLVLVVVASCSRGTGDQDRLFREYLWVQGFTESDAPVGPDEISELTGNLCEMDGVRLAAYLDASDRPETAGRALEVALTQIRCPEESAKFTAG